jgi:serine/threonine protein kinase
MSSSEAQPAEPYLSFDEFVRQNLLKIEADFYYFINPILNVVYSLHKRDSFHGGIFPSALRFGPNGKLDSEYLYEQRRTAGALVDPRVPHAFLAPEALDGSGEDSRTDSYALGALIYYIVTGSPPTPASRRVTDGPQLTPTDYPRWKPSVLNAANGCLRLAKDARIKNAEELDSVLTAEAPARNTISREADGETTAPNPAPTADKPERPPPEPVVPPTPAALPVKLQIRERLPNASVGKPFRQNLRELFGERVDRVAAIAIELPESSGLVFDEAESVLHGTPTTAGEVNLVLSYRLAESPPERPALTHTVALTVNPDPSSLWKNRRSDKNGAFAKPDTDSAFLVTQHLTVMAASLRGRSHAHEGKYREDDFGLHFIEATGWHILISADGAGSAKFSRRGSQLACQTALAVIEEKLGDEKNQLNTALSKLGASHETADLEKLRQLSYNVLMLAAHQAHSAIQKQAKESQATPRDFASTFIVVIARRVESRWFFASFAIGDGGAGALLEDGTLLSLTSPDSGDFAGQTVFITMPQVFSDPAALLARTHAAFCPGFKFLAAMSDGITDPIFQSDANLASSTEWKKWQQDLEQIVSLEAPKPGMEAKLLDYLNFASPGNHDDRTLLIAVPTPSKT